MKIIRLEMLNLASLDRPEGEVINFDKGALGESNIFSIVGPTGSGKSTILDAICLALYNRAPRYPRKKGERGRIEIYGEESEGEKNRLSPTDARNILTRGKKYGYSKLAFQANNGDIYRAEWKVTRKTKNYENAVTTLFKIKNVDGVPTEEIAAWSDLPRIIGLDYDQFLRTVLIAQGSFSSFIKAKEEERYQLLENLIGCEELYTGIAAKIKNRKDEASKQYTQIAAHFSAQEKDLIAEDNLAALQTRISGLEAVEARVKEELLKVTEALAWYATNDKIIENIDRFNRKFLIVRQHLEEMGPQIDRLELHDATIEAVNLFKEIKTAQSNINRHELRLKSLEQQIKDKSKEISDEENLSLAKLKEDLKTANERLAQQKPHIEAAKTIKTQIDVLKNTLAEKNAIRSDALDAMSKSQKEYDDNKAEIEKLAASLQNEMKNLDDLQAHLKREQEAVNLKAEKAICAFENEKAKIENVDSLNLQEAKTKADKALADLTSAVRSYKSLSIKENQKKDNLSLRKQLDEENSRLSASLASIDIQELAEELDVLNKSYTLLTSENWENHRSSLVEGEPCPLCGAHHHPYSEKDAVKPVVDKMKAVINEKRLSLEKARAEKDRLLQKQGENNGKLERIIATLANLDSEIDSLVGELNVIHNSYPIWPKSEEGLLAMKPKIEKEAFDSEKELVEFNRISKSVDELRKQKELSEKEKREWEKSSAERLQKAQERINVTKLALEAEKGKTGNLAKQLDEKQEALQKASDAAVRCGGEMKAKTDLLKQEIGDKDPDSFEKELTLTIERAQRSVDDKMAAIAVLGGLLNKMKGEETATKSQIENEQTNLSEKKAALENWLTDYNDAHPEPLTTDDIAALFSSTDDWESIRDRQKSIRDAYTSSETTLKNEQKALDDHQSKKPQSSKDSLLELKSELDRHSNEELIEAKSRVARHENAKREMGAMFERRQEAESLKQEWDEIADAIGAEGKTLRKIAQCYTLRFLIEHANAEIRKFNSRYELQQVSNSLGIRVIDHDRADDVRDTTSLSGGETFIVSLGLALGLSALSSRNISFENLFIDEGFGTLDPDTLDSVIDSLSMLQTSQGRKVGVISHTEAMSERIATQIRVVKHGNSGSSHIEIYPEY